jgi:PPOX class probable F420-dependent enzyme
MGWQHDFIAQHRVARLATVDAEGQPHVVPIVYAFDGARLFSPIDEKPKRAGAYHLRRVRNIQSNPRVAVIIDDYSEDWRQLAWVQIRGQAALAESGADYQAGLELLTRKYPQYVHSRTRPQLAAESERRLEQEMVTWQFSKIEETRAEHWLATCLHTPTSRM